MIMACACESGSNWAASDNPPSSILAGKTAIAPCSICPADGVQTGMGFDVNQNNVLDTNEITSTKYVCNGPGAGS